MVSQLIAQLASLMTVIFLTIPLMLLAIAIATAPLVVAMIHQQRLDLDDSDRSTSEFLTQQRARQNEDQVPANGLLVSAAPRS